MAFTDSEYPNVIGKFAGYWQKCTDDNNLTLHGFRRFKTTHLLNLRFLEDEIAELDHALYQAGLSLDMGTSPNDRLGLRHSKKDSDVSSIKDTITKGFILKLRGLIKQYDEALANFNNIMNMETFALIDDEKQSSLRDDLTMLERYKTRLVRADLGPRSRTDPFQRRLHTYLRKLRFWRLSKRSGSIDPESCKISAAKHDWSYQNTALLAEIIGRTVIAALTVIFLVVPLVILSHSVSKNVQLAITSIFIVVFAILVSIMLKASNLELMVVSAAYAAVLSVFVSNVPSTNT